MLNEETAYRYHESIKRHFTTDRYDIFEDGVDGTIKISTPEERKIFTSIAKSFNERNINEMIYYFLSNFVYNRKDYTLNEDNAFKAYMTWNYRKNNIIKIFTDDLSIILENVQKAPYNKPHFLKSGVNGETPYLFLLFEQGKITIETVKILGDVSEAINEWKSDVRLLEWVDLIRILNKLDGFIKYDYDAAWLKWVHFRNIFEDLKQV